MLKNILEEKNNGGIHDSNHKICEYSKILRLKIIKLQTETHEVDNGTN